MKKVPYFLPNATVMEQCKQGILEKFLVKIKKYLHNQKNILTIHMVLVGIEK